MRTSESTAAVFAALAKAQSQLQPAIKDSDNPAFRSKYADLTSHVEAIRPAFAANGLCVLQDVTSDEHGVSVTTRIGHLSGEWAEFGPLYIPANKHDAHGYGSATSYARRYGLSAAAGTVADDDDGNAAVESKKAAVKAMPTGYEDWVLDMTTLSGEVDLHVFRDSYTASKRSYREYLETNHPLQKEEWKARAKKNSATLIPGS